MVKQHLFQNHLSFIALLETKLKDTKIPSVTKRIAVDWKWHSNVTNSEKARIMILWNSDILDVQITHVSSQQITCRVKSVDGRTDCIVSAIYGSNHQVIRKELWAELCQIFQTTENLPWLLCGDFNTMISNEEKLGGSVLTDSDTNDFTSFIENCNLSHLKALGSFFTWNNKQDHATRVWCRLDRALVNDSWIQIHNSSHVEFLLPNFSDHSPAVVSIYEDDLQRKKPFKFFKMWTNHINFLPTVSATWNKKIEGYSMFSVVTKLKLLRDDLKDLNRKHFGNISEQVLRAKIALEDIQGKLQEDPLNPVLISQEKESLSKYNNLLNCELSFLQLKARTQWSIKGDRCTNYFHSILKAKRHQNRILVLYNSSGIRLTEGDDIINELISFGPIQQLRYQTHRGR
ncbi:uncharacterized protein LOC109836222 [Asparagus officinalis]|uniref:uncharacterized protein LOC109836222 n=1 Tax=Asparagus officinalis TaxID=4686 RepID=UPI00098E6E7B|nr:uncharacterized protein LOC109836222 [Asparagus officinalis]